jgi:ankyrin repeat protein
MAGIDLVAAVASGDYATSKRLVEEEHADVTVVDQYGRKLLCTSSYFGYTPIVQLLLANAATDVDGANADGWTPLNIACCMGFPLIVSLLVEAGADQSITNVYGHRKPIEIAEVYDQADIVELLNKLQNSAKEKQRRLLVALHRCAARQRAKNKALNVREASSCDVRVFDRNNPGRQGTPRQGVIHAAEQGNVAAVQELLEGGYDVNEMTSTGVTALMKAAHAGHVAVVKELLRHEADITLHDFTNSTTALVLACATGRVEVVELLLLQAQNGANTGFVRDADNECRCPLLYASRRGHLQVVNLLLASSADPNQHDETGLTPLIAAAQTGHSLVVQLLLEQGGARVNQGDDMGTTALHAASWKGHLEVVGVLLGLGADTSREDVEGMTPLLWAEEGGHAQVVERLLRQRRQGHT